MIIQSNIKTSLENDLKQANKVWVASAMISKSGWSFLQENIPQTAIQSYLIGIDLATDPQVFECLLANLAINARVYETQYTFHPKVYLIQHEDESLIAFIGSSNTTSWGLEKNVEMNFRLDNQKECRKLLTWFNGLFSEGYFITQSFVDDYKAKFQLAFIKAKEINKEALSIKNSLTKNNGQFFSSNDHTIFQNRFHYIEKDELIEARNNVKNKFKLLHREIYPQFDKFGLNDLHAHYHTQNIVSNHRFNRWSGYFIGAMWLHYGKSADQLKGYRNSDVSINKPDSFINNIRLQVIIHDDSIGIWLVLGRNNGSFFDRRHFNKQMEKKETLIKFYNYLKSLKKDYWINISERKSINDINNPKELSNILKKERIDEYFIIGKDINKNDPFLSRENIANTILEEFKSLYPLYEMMKDR